MGLIETQTADILLCDPPWSFKTYSEKGMDRAADNHYTTQGLDAMKALPVADVASPGAILFLWVVDPMLPQALSVLDAWDFEFKTVGFYWCKENRVSPGDFIGLGYYTRANCEQCWIARRKGSKKGLPRMDKGIPKLLRSIEDGVLDDNSLQAKLGRHSQKPEVVQDRIDRLFGDSVVEKDDSTRPLRKLELFARRRREGWLCAGLELDGMDHSQSIPMIALGTYPDPPVSWSAAKARFASGSPEWTSWSGSPEWTSWSGSPEEVQSGLPIWTARSGILQAKSPDPPLLKGAA